MEKIYIDSTKRSEEDIVKAAIKRCEDVETEFNRDDSYDDIIRELYTVAYSKGVRDQRDFEDNKRRDPVNYHNGE